MASLTPRLAVVIVLTFLFTIGSGLPKPDSADGKSADLEGAESYYGGFGYPYYYGGFGYPYYSGFWPGYPYYSGYHDGYYGYPWWWWWY